MKNYLQSTFLCCWLVSGTVLADVFEAGIAALHRGHYETALREWRPLAEQGNAVVQFNLGVMYDKGRGVTQDNKTAVKWYRLAAEQDYSPAQVNLNKLQKKIAERKFQKGLDAYKKKNYATALREWKPIAEQGFAPAQYNLGIMYANGRGVPQDYKTAVKWYRLAAEQGRTSAQASLGVRYAFGQGVLKDYVYAHMWGSLAASNGNKKGGKLRDFVEKKMTPTDISAAQKLARECVRKKYKDC